MCAPGFSRRLRVWSVLLTAAVKPHSVYTDNQDSRKLLHPKLHHPDLHASSRCRVAAYGFRIQKAPAYPEKALLSSSHCRHDEAAESSFALHLTGAFRASRRTVFWVYCGLRLSKGVRTVQGFVHFSESSGQILFVVSARGCRPRAGSLARYFLPYDVNVKGYEL